MLRIWADGTWQWGSETPHGHLSDDYAEVAVPEWCDDEDAERIAAYAQIYGRGVDEFVRWWFGL